MSKLGLTELIPMHGQGWFFLEVPGMFLAISSF